jgi:hypothetical protein
MSEVQEKDYFWFYVAGVIFAVVALVFIIKGSEHGKFESTAKAISENPSNSAYRNNNL